MTIEENLKRLRHEYTKLGFTVSEISKFNLATDTLTFHKLHSPAVALFVSEFLEEALSQTETMNFIRQELSE